MLLRNIGTGYERSSTDFKSNEAESVHLFFGSFGRGTERTPDFAALFEWDDVEALIQAFTKINHPAALRHARALALASAVEDLAKNSS
jgi:hypothetical protein